MHFSFFTHPLHFWLSPIQPGSSYILKISVTYGKMWSKISVPARADHSWWSASAGWFLSAEVSQRLWGSAAAVVSSSDPVWSSCHVWEAVTDLWFLCLCLGWPALSNLPHVWALCAAFEPMFPWCDLHFCVKGRWTLWRAGCLWSSWLHVPCVQLSVGASSRCYSQNREEESERFPLVMENMPNISRKKKSLLFASSLLPLALVFLFSFFIIAEDSSSELLEVSPLVVNLDALGVSRSGFAMPKAQRHFRYKHPPHPYMLPQPQQRQAASGQNPQRPATELLPCHPPLCTAVEKGQCRACIYSFFF